MKFDKHEIRRGRGLDGGLKSQRTSLKQNERRELFSMVCDPSLHRIVTSGIGGPRKSANAAKKRQQHIANARARAETQSAAYARRVR